MAGITVSTSEFQLVELKKKGLKPSQVFQVGAEIVLSGGGLDSFNQMKEKNKILEDRIIILEEINKSLRQRLESNGSPQEIKKEEQILKDRYGI